MKVYVLAEVGYDQFDIRGVFTSLDQAKAAAPKPSEPDYEWRRNERADVPLWVMGHIHGPDWWIEEHELTDGPQ